MPTIFKMGLTVFFFYAGDRDEPLHIHVEHDDRIAKFWIDPIRLQMSGGFNRTELVKINKIIIENQTLIKEAWNEYFGN